MENVIVLHNKGFSPPLGRNPLMWIRYNLIQQQVNRMADMENVMVLHNKGISPPPKYTLKILVY